jgi:hypothetical protein
VHKFSEESMVDFFGCIIDHYACRLAFAHLDSPAST